MVPVPILGTRSEDEAIVEADRRPGSKDRLEIRHVGDGKTTIRESFCLRLMEAVLIRRATFVVAVQLAEERGEAGALNVDLGEGILQLILDEHDTSGSGFCATFGAPLPPLLLRSQLRLTLGPDQGGDFTRVGDSMQITPTYPNSPSVRFTVASTACTGLRVAITRISICTRSGAALANSPPYPSTYFSLSTCSSL